MRDTRVDNIKGVLIATVVLGHVIQVIPALASWLRGGPWSLLYTFIYLFHMPAFVFVSGYLSSPKKTLIHAVRDVLLLYAVAQAAWVAFSYALSFAGGDRVTWMDATGVMPGWGLWYLLSLFFWRASVPLLVRCKRRPAWLLAMCVVAAVLGETPVDGALSLSRTIAFLPFFAGGFWSRDRLMLAAPGRRASDILLIGAGAIIAPIATLYAYRHYIPETQFAGPFSSKVGQTGILFRAGMIVVGGAAIRALFLFTPARRGIITELGVNTLSVYLAQFYVLQPLCLFLPHSWWHPNMKWAAPTLTLLCCGLAILRPGELFDRARSTLDRMLFPRSERQPA